jgi:hypothetical protein
MEATMNTILWVLFWTCLTFLVITAWYLIAALMFSKSNVNTFYIAIPVNRFAFVTKGGVSVGIIFNSNNVKLIADPDTTKYPFGKFVPKDADGEDLQKLGPIEKMLGIRYIGIPFIHGLLKKKLTWETVEGKTLTKHTEEEVCFFAITKTFGFTLEGLALGRDSDGNPIPVTGDDQGFERILVDLKFALQGFIENPYRAIVETNWMAGVKAKLSSFAQPVLGRTSQDELIARKKADGSRHCELVQAILDNRVELETFGVTFEEEKITYIDYDLAGDEATKKKIQDANTERFDKKQKAAGIRETKKAEQADAEELQRIILDLDIKLKNQGYNDTEQRQAMIQTFLKTQAMVKTSLNTWVDGGGGVTTAITAENKKDGRK